MQPTDGTRIPLLMVRQPAEEQQQFARWLPPYPDRKIARTGWRRWAVGSGFHLSLPQDFKPQAGLDRLHHLWMSAKGSQFLLVEHDGDGSSAPGVGFDSDDSVRRQPSIYCVSVVGSTGTMEMWSSYDPGGTTYYVSMNVALRDGYGLGVVASTLDPIECDVIIAAIRSINNNHSA